MVRSILNLFQLLILISLPIAYAAENELALETSFGRETTAAQAMLKSISELDQAELEKVDNLLINLLKILPESPVAKLEHQKKKNKKL